MVTVTNEESEEYEIDPDFVDFISGGQFDNEFNLRMEQKRKVNNIERAKMLLTKEPINEEDFRNMMIRNYSLTGSQFSKCLEELANSNDVDVRVSLDNHKIEIKKK